MNPFVFRVLSCETIKTLCMKKTLSVLMAIVICFFTGWLSSLLNTPAIDGWYQSLDRSSLTPPDYVFPVVWTILYLLMGISA